MSRPTAFALAALIAAASAVPASAQRFAPSLPPAPRGVDFVESVCTGGIDGRYEQTRLLASGRVQKVTRRAPMISAPVPRADVAAVQRDLDRAGFDRRTIPQLPPRIRDGITCTLTRRHAGRTHSLRLSQEAANLPVNRDLVRVLNRIATIARDATKPELRPVAAP